LFMFFMMVFDCVSFPVNSRVLNNYGYIDLLGYLVDSELVFGNLNGDGNFLLLNIELSDFTNNWNLNGNLLSCLPDVLTWDLDNTLFIVNFWSFNFHNHLNLSFGIDFNNLGLLDDLVHDELLLNNFDLLIDNRYWHNLVLDALLFNNVWDIDSFPFFLGLSSTFFADIFVMEITPFISSLNFALFNGSFRLKVLVLELLLNIWDVLDSVNSECNFVALVDLLGDLNDSLVFVWLLDTTIFIMWVFLGDNTLMFSLNDLTSKLWFFNDTFNGYFNMFNDLIFAGNLNQALNCQRYWIFNNLEAGLFHNTLEVVRLETLSDMLLRHLDDMFNTVRNIFLNDLFCWDFNNPVDIVSDMNNVFYWSDSFNKLLNLNKTLNWSLVGVLRCANRLGLAVINRSWTAVVHRLVAVDVSTKMSTYSRTSGDITE